MNAPLDINTIRKIATEIQVILGLKLIQLKRRASGSLINSFTHKISLVNEFDLSIQIKGLNYWKVVEYGVNPAAVPYSPDEPARKATSLYIEGLMKWIRIKGIASQNDVVRGIAFAIARKATGKKGGGSKGIPFDKSKLGFIRKTRSERDHEVKKIADVYNKTITTAIKSLTGDIELVIK
jgi:hypothetical protein